MKHLLNRRAALLQTTVAAAAFAAGCATKEPPIIKVEEFQRRKKEGEPIRVACVGDSITFGAGLRDREKNNYPKQLATLLGTSFTVSNFGRNGATLSKAGDLPYWTTPEFAGANDLKPDVVILMLGTNDTKPQNWKDSKTFAADLNALITHFQDLRPKPMIWVCLPVPVFQDTSGIRASILKRGVIPAIMDVCTDRKIPVIDLHDAMEKQASYFPDGIHPDDDGAAMIAKYIYQAIRP